MTCFPPSLYSPCHINTKAAFYQYSSDETFTDQPLRYAIKYCCEEGHFITNVSDMIFKLHTQIKHGYASLGMLSFGSIS